MSILSNVKSAARGALNVIQSPAKRSEFISSLDIDSGCPTIILANTAAYRNLGDHAITMGEYAFLEHYFPQYQIIEITSPQWRAMCGLNIAEQLGDVKAVFLQGGGHMGTLWGGHEEDSAMNVVKHAPAHVRCAYFPQTVFYEEGIAAEKKLRQRKSFYREHKNVFFTVRDRQSFDFMHTEFPDALARTVFSPDIALFVEDSLPMQRREGVTLCFRNDEEKISNNATLGKIITLLKNKGFTYHYTDTVAEKMFPLEEREHQVFEKFNEFKRSKLVITDRLHAMVFCAITHTPCIAFNNLNGKVEGVYQWIKNLNFIKVTSPERVTERLITELMDCDTTQLPTPRQLLQQSYDDLAQCFSQFTDLQISVEGM